MRFVDEPTVVDARFEVDGQVRPRRFTWDQRWMSVTDIGRQWVDLEGRHVLVMAHAARQQGDAELLTTGRHTFELLLERQNLVWRVVRLFDDVITA
jgi:hypothetical protein